MRHAKLLLLCMLTAAVVGAACAQEETSKPWAVKVGFYRPDSYAWREASSGTPKGTWWWMGLDWRFGSLSEGNDCLVTVEHKLVSQELARMTSLQGVYVHRFGAPSESDARWYYGAGLGMYFARVRQAGAWGNATRIGVPLVLGKDFGNGVFGELKYHAVFGKARGIHLSGFSVALGFRF
ncbi:MAG: hypothetical protein ACUVTZ_10070 [Armatimonadota bacterium]